MSQSGIEERFGAELRRRREDAGLSIRKAATEADVSEALWRQMESGYRTVAAGIRVPSANTPKSIRAVARVLNWDLIHALRMAGHRAEAEKERDRRAALRQEELFDADSQVQHHPEPPPDSSTTQTVSEQMILELVELKRRVAELERRQHPPTEKETNE